MNIKLSKKIFSFCLFILFSGYALASSIVGLNTKEKELTKIPYFLFNYDEVISQNGESISSNDNNSLDFAISVEITCTTD